MYWALCKNMTSCLAVLKEERGYMLLPRCTFPLLFASLNLLQTWSSLCLVSCQPCGWHMLTLQLRPAGYRCARWPVALGYYVPELMWSGGQATTEGRHVHGNNSGASTTVATWKAPLWGSATLQMVSFPRPLNNNSAPISPRARCAESVLLNGNKSARLCSLIEHWSVYFLETVTIDYKIPIKTQLWGKISPFSTSRQHFSTWDES